MPACKRPAGSSIHHPENYLPWESSPSSRMFNFCEPAAPLSACSRIAPLSGKFLRASVAYRAGVETETYWGRQRSGRESYLLSTGRRTARADCVRSRDFSSRQAEEAFLRFGSISLCVRRSILLAENTQIHVNHCIGFAFCFLEKSSSLLAPSSRYSRRAERPTRPSVLVNGR